MDNRHTMIAIGPIQVKAAVATAALTAAAAFHLKLFKFKER